jgi:hypothetical protein
MFSTVCALPSPTSAEGCPSLFGWFTGVGSEEAGSRAASVRRSICTYGFPVCSFHEDCFVTVAIEGINPTKLTSPNSPYSLAVGSCLQPPLRQRLNRCEDDLSAPESLDTGMVCRSLSGALF